MILHKNTCKRTLETERVYIKEIKTWRTEVKTAKHIEKITRKRITEKNEVGKYIDHVL